MADLKAAAKAALQKFDKLPTAGKVAVAGGAGLVFYLFFKGSKDTAEDEATSTDEATFYYPMAEQEVTTGSTGTETETDTSGGSSTVTGVTWDDLNASNNAMMDFINSNYEVLDGQYKTYAEEILSNSQQQQAASVTDIVTGREGSHVYGLTTYADGSKVITKDGAVVPKENYQYIPQEYGGSRLTGSGLGETTVTGGSSSAKSSSGSNSSYSSADAALQKAQAAYGSATTQKEKDAAAAAGQAARAAGATDSGAQKVWSSI